MFPGEGGRPRGQDHGEKARAGTNDVSQVFERGWNISVGPTALLQEVGQILLGVVETNIRCNESHSLRCVGFDKLPYAASQHRTNQDIRIENDHLNERRFSRAGALS